MNVFDFTFEILHFRLASAIRIQKNSSKNMRKLIRSDLRVKVFEYFQFHIDFMLSKIMFLTKIIFLYKFPAQKGKSIPFQFTIGQCMKQVLVKT